jgi:hypothetical protein
MGDTIHNGPGDDIKVFEGGTPDEGFICYASEKMDGQWIQLGTGTGTASFDLSSGPIENARYFRIKDDGDGAQNGADIGYDLDAVQMLTLPMSPTFMADDNTVHEGSPVNFSDLSSGTPSSWHWLFPGGTPSESTEKNPDGIVYNTEGTYDVTLSVSNGLSLISLTKPGYINVSKPDAICSKDKDQRISVIPNPSDGRIRLEIKDFKGGSYRICSNLGRLVHEDIISNDEFTTDLNFTEMPSGLYFLHITSPGESVTTKIIIL